MQGKARLGAIVHQKNAAALALTAVKNEDQREFAKLVDSFKSQFNEGARVQVCFLLPPYVVPQSRYFRTVSQTSGDLWLMLMPLLCLPTSVETANLSAFGVSTMCILYCFLPEYHPLHAAVAAVFVLLEQWGGGIMGMKSQHKQKQKERVLAKELAQRMTV